jgi:hypothetical protein
MVTLRIGTFARRAHSARTGRLAVLAGAGAALLIAGCAPTGASDTDAAQGSRATAATVSSAAPETTAAPEITGVAPAPVEASAPVEEEAAPAPVAPQPVAAQPTAAQPTAPQQAAPVEAQHEEPAPVEEPAAQAPVAQPGYGCDAALSYLRANAHPAFTLVCPGYAFGGQAVTCINHAPECPSSAVIIINNPCPVAYMNEAANSWTLYNGTNAVIDPFGASC